MGRFAVNPVKVIKTSVELILKILPKFIVTMQKLACNYI